MLELVPPRHGLGDEVATHLARVLAGTGAEKKNHDVGTVARARSLDRRGQPHATTGLGERATSSIHVLLSKSTARNQQVSSSKSG